MHSKFLEITAILAIAALVNAAPVKWDDWQQEEYLVSYGPRPYYILHNMTEGPLKTKLESCQNGPFSITGWSIGHRGGGTLQIPEETVESTLAGARMGAGVLECDVAFTSDLELVCRHSLCDLHTTTDILVRPDLAAKCTIPFTPANDTADASALCCTSDITLDEFTSLCSKMDAFNASATTPEDFIAGGVQPWRTTLYDTCATVLTLESWIDLVETIPGHRNYTPELKTPPEDVPMPFNGYTQAQYARDLLDTFTRKGINPDRVWPQSFLPDDVWLWIEEYPDTYGPQAVYLDEDGDTPETFVTAVARIPELAARGLKVIAPPFNYLLTVGGENNDTIIPSSYATAAKEAGLAIIAWSFERSGPLADVQSTEDYYYSTFASAIHTDGQYFEVLDVLANEIGIAAMFSDWSSTTGYFANCFGLTGIYGEDY